MNTIQNLSYVLRGLAIAGLCAAGLAAAAPASAPSTDMEPLNLQPNAAASTFIAPPPLLVAPTCPTCWIWRGLSAPGAVTAPSAPLHPGAVTAPSAPLQYRTPLRLAGGPPTSVVDACRARQCAG